MWGITPSAGIGSRLQPLACSKELLPVGSWADGEVERPKAVSEYLARHGSARGILAGEYYVDVGTVSGYREAIRLLAAAAQHRTQFPIHQGRMQPK